jgi:tight adherence protein B
VSGAAALLFLSAGLLLALAGLLYFGSRHIDVQHMVQQRFQNLTMGTALEDPKTGGQRTLADWWSRKLLRAGMADSGNKGLLVLAILTTATVAGVAGWGVAGLSLPAGLLMAMHVYLEQRFRMRTTVMLAQLPGFIDHMVRGLGTGRTIENTFLQAIQHCRSPLQDILERVRLNVELGARLDEELQHAARVHRLRELQLLALAIHVNLRFGGSARELLQSIVTMIQQRDQARRELHALTGETRLSAWVLGLLPISVAAYMMLVNPSYLEVMWHDENGREVLLTALLMQFLGGVVLWRMVRSI